MLIATIAALMLIFGGESLEFFLTNLKKPVKEHVADKTRQDVILDASKALGKELKALEEHVVEDFEDLIEVHGEFESTPADYDAAGEILKADQKKLSALVLAARDTMKANMTREEWEAVFNALDK